MDNTNPRASRGKRNGIGKNFRDNYDSIDWGREKTEERLPWMDEDVKIAKIESDLGAA